jgi:hypothetical protein
MAEIPLIIERLTLTGGAGHGLCNADAQIRFVVNNSDAVANLQFVIRTDDDPKLSVIQARIFEAIELVRPQGKAPK